MDRLARHRGATTITMAHITFSMAYVAVVVRSRLAGMDESLEEAAMDLGGRPLAVFFDITVPMLLPALVSGWLLAFTLSLDDLVISSFVSSRGRLPPPMLIFAKVRLGVTPDINAIATIIIALVAVGVVTAALLTRRREGAAAPRASFRRRRGGKRHVGSSGKLGRRPRCGECIAIRSVRDGGPPHFHALVALRRAPEPVPGRGDYFLFEIAGESVIVIRDAEAASTR